MQSPQKQPSYIRASTTSILCLTWQTLTGSCSLGTICLNYGQSMTLLLPKLGHRSLTYFNTVSLSLIRDLYLGQCPFVFPQVIHMDVVGPAGIFGHRSLTYFFTVSVSAWSVTSALARVHLFPPRSYTWMSWNQREVSDIDHWLILSLSISAWSVTPTMARVHLFFPGHTHGCHGTRGSFWT